MRLPNQRSLARPKRINRPVIWQLLGGVLLSLILLAGCAGGTSGTSRFSDFFKGASPTPSPTAAPIPTVAPSPSGSPQAAETTGQGSKRTARQARAASENAANASREAAEASAAAARASKQAASVANRIEGTGPTSADVSLENSSGTTVAVNPAGGGAIRNAATPTSSPSLISSARDSSARTTPAVSSPALAPMGTSGESDLAKAAKLIRNVDAMDKRVDRKNLSADDSQRDILAQKLLQEAKKALVDRDSVAAISLATKASTLFEPLPKLAESSIAPSAP